MLGYFFLLPLVWGSLHDETFYYQVTVLGNVTFIQLMKSGSVGYVRLHKEQKTN